MIGEMYGTRATLAFQNYSRAYLEAFKMAFGEYAQPPKPRPTFGATVEAFGNRMSVGMERAMIGRVDREVLKAFADNTFEGIASFGWSPTHNPWTGEPYFRPFGTDFNSPEAAAADFMGLGVGVAVPASELSLAMAMRSVNAVGTMTRKAAAVASGIPYRLEFNRQIFSPLQFNSGVPPPFRVVSKQVIPKSRGLWQLTAEGADKVMNHGRFGTFYRSASDGLWWSADNAGHGGSAFKVFRETGEGLEWFRDADMFGDFIKGKHKGATGQFIPWNEFRVR